MEISFYAEAVYNWENMSLKSLIFVSAKNMLFTSESVRYNNYKQLFSCPKTGTTIRKQRVFLENTLFSLKRLGTTIINS